MMLPVLGRLLALLILLLPNAVHAAAATTLDNDPTYSTDVTPTIGGDYTGAPGGESVVVEVRSGGVAITSAVDNTPSGTNEPFSVSPTGGMVLGSTYDLQVRVYDADGGAGALLGTFNFPGALILDGTQPDLQSVVITGTNPAAPGSVQFLATFSEAVTGVGTGDFTKTGTTTGGSVASVSGSGSTRTITVNGFTGNGTVGITAAGGITITDLAGNGIVTPVSPSPNQTYTIDGTAPTVASILRLGSDPTASSPLTFSVAFSEPVSGVVAGNFSAATTGSVSTGAIGISGSGQVYTVSVPVVSGTGTVGLTVTAAGITDLVGNALGSGTPTGVNQIYTFQTAAPTVSSITLVNGNPTTSGSVQFLVTYSTTVTGDTNANYTAAVTGTVAVGGVSRSGSGATRTVTVTGITGDGTLGLNIGLAPVIEDSLGNDLASGTPTGANLAYTVDNTAPTVASVTRLDASPLDTGTVSFSVAFSESVSNVVLARFTAATTGTVTTGALGLSGSGQTYTVTVPVTGGNGTVGLTINTGSIQDTAGSGLSSGTPTGTNQTYTVDNTAPTVDSIILLDPSPTGASSVRFLVTFSESVTGVDPADFAPAPSAGVSANGTVAVAGSSNAYTVTVSSVFSASTGSLGLTVNTGGLTDLAGNALASGTPTGSNLSYSITQSAPTLTYYYSTDTWAMMEDHPSTVTAPLWDDALVTPRMSVSNYPVNGVATPYTTNLFGNENYPWFPIELYTTYPAYTTLISPPLYGDTPPHTVRSLPHLWFTQLDNLGSATFTAINETGFIDLTLTIPTVTPVGPLTTSTDSLDFITLNGAWAGYYDLNLTINEGAKTISYNGTQIATWADVGNSRTVRITIGSNAVPVATATVSYIISLVEARLGGRNASPSLRRLSATVTNPAGRTSNTIAASIRPYLYDDNARVSAAQPVDISPADIVVLPGISRTGSVGVDDVDSAFSFAVQAAPAQGTLNVDASTGFYTYTASLAAIGTDTFTIRVTDLGPVGSTIWYGQPRIPTTDVVYTVVVADPFDAQAPVITSNPPMEVESEGALTYTIQITPGVATPIMDMALIGLDPASFDVAHRPSLTWNGANWVLTWPMVPQPTHAYYDFGLLLTVEDGSVAPPRPLRAAFQPVLLKVRNLSGGG